MARMISSCLRSMSQHTCAFVMNLLATIRSRDGDGWVQRGARAFHSLVQIVLVHLDTNEAETELGTGHGRGAESQERIGHQPRSLQAIQSKAHFRKLRGERGRVGPVLGAAL